MKAQREINVEEGGLADDDMEGFALFVSVGYSCSCILTRHACKPCFRDMVVCSSCLRGGVLTLSLAQTQTGKAALTGWDDGRGNLSSLTKLHHR